MLPTEGIAAKQERAPWLKQSAERAEKRAADKAAFVLSARAANLAGLDSNWPKAFCELASLSNDWGKVLAGSAIADVHGRENLTQVRKILNSVRY